MNKKVSGGQSIIVPINRIGKNYLPFIEDLKDRVVKYIDVLTVLGYATILPDGSNTFTSGSETEFTTYLTLMNKNGVVQDVANIPLVSLSTFYNGGEHYFVGRKISLQNSYLTVTDPNLIGKSILLVVWYDEPLFSARNSTNNLCVETVEVEYRNNTFKNLFPDNRTLAGKRIRKIIIDPVYKTPSYRDCANLQDAMPYLTLNNGNVSILKEIPFQCLVNQNGLVQWELEFANIKFDLTNSYIQTFGDADFVAGQSFLVRFVFEA